MQQVRRPVLGYIPLAPRTITAQTATVKHGISIRDVIFHAANHSIPGLLVVALYFLASAVTQFDTLVGTLILGVAVTGAIYLMCTWLVAFATSCDSGESAWRIWKERFGWLGISCLVMGVVSAILVYSYRRFGIVGILPVALPLGVLYFVQRQYKEDEQTSATVTELQTANAELQRQAEEISVLSEDILLTLSRSVELRDPNVVGHSKRVAQYATHIARELGMPQEQVERIEKASRLHDIGTFGLPETLLLKDSVFTDAEYKLMQLHSAEGALVVSQCKSLRPLAPIIRSHHERFDGQGYPDQLSGQDIPLEARVITLADCVDAMASDRPYRCGMNPQEVIREVHKCSGTQFDPQVVDAFFRLIEREGECFIGNPGNSKNPCGSAYGIASLRMAGQCRAIAGQVAGIYGRCIAGLQLARAAGTGRVFNTA